MGNHEEPKPIHVVHCRECDGYHRISVKTTTFAISAVAEPIPEMLMAEVRKKLFRGEIKCPTTGETFIAAEDDWLHLTEEEFQAFVKRK